MAGSRRSPVLRDQWRATSDTRDPRDREKHRPRGSYRDRGRDKFRDRERRRRPKEGRPDDELPLRSPPPRPFPPPPHHEPRQHRDLSPSTVSARGSPGHPHSEFHPGRKLGRDRSPLPADYPGLESRRSLEAENTNDRGHHRRDHSPSAPPPFKRKRTRSPSPSGFDQPPTRPSHRYPPSNHSDDLDRGLPSNRRGRFATRGRSGRRPSPRRGRDRRPPGGRRPISPRPRRSRSPVRGGKSYAYPRRRFHSPLPEDELENEPRYRSPSRHSVQSGDSRLSIASRRNSLGDPTMNSARPARSAAGDSFRSLSPSREAPGHDADNASVSANGETSRDAFQRPRTSRPYADASQYSSTMQNATPTNSYHGSPQPGSPYSGGRGGRGQHV